MTMHEVFEQQYETKEARKRYGKLEGWLLDVAKGLDLDQQEWMCLMDCLNGTMYHHEISLLEGCLEGEIEAVKSLDPDRFDQWGVDCVGLIAKIRPLTTIQRLALHYRVEWLFDNPSAVGLSRA